MSNGNDSRFSSRKFLLALGSIIIATLTMWAMEMALYQLALQKLLDGDTYRLAAVAVLSWWLFCDGVVLGGYGIPNVIEKWSPPGGTP